MRSIQVYLSALLAHSTFAMENEFFDAIDYSETSQELVDSIDYQSPSEDSEEFFDATDYIQMSRDIRQLAKANKARNWDSIFEQLNVENNNIDINAKDLEKGKTLLHYAASQNRDTEVKKLLDLGAEIEGTDVRNNWTALHYAVRKGGPDVFDTLAERNANLAAMTKGGMCPVRMLCEDWTLELYLDDVARILMKRLFRNSTFSENDIVHLLYTNQFQKIETIKNEEQLNFLRVLRLRLLKLTNVRMKNFYSLGK